MKTKTPIPEPIVSDTTPYVPTGRPVPKFVGALVVLFLLGIAIYGSGLFRNQLQANGSGGSSFDEITMEAVAFIEVENRGLLPATIVEVGGDTFAELHGLTEIDEDDNGSVSLDGIPAVIEPVKIGPGATALVAFSYRVDCSEFNVGDMPSLELTVENTLGTRRTMTVNQAAVNWCNVGQG